MDVLQFIVTQCDQLTATAGPRLNQTGVQMVLALATIMMVWFGIQEAVASARGGPGFNIGAFLNFVMLFAFAYTMVNFYATEIPGLGFSLRSFIKDGTNALVADIGYDTTNNIQDQVAARMKTSGNLLAAFTGPYTTLVVFVVQVLLSALSAVATLIVAYGAIGATVVGLLGPILIPFLVIKQLDWLFWGWLKAFVAFSFYKVVTAATLSVMATVFTDYLTQHIDFAQPTQMVKDFPIIMTLILVCVFILTKIPAMVTTIFSGSTGGHDAGTGLLTGLILRR